MKTITIQEGRDFADFRKISYSPLIKTRHSLNELLNLE